MHRPALSPRAMGGTSDHVLLLVRLHPSIAVARLMAEVKGFSSHAVSRFRWQKGYGVFSVSYDDLPAVESASAGGSRTLSKGELTRARGRGSWSSIAGVGCAF